MKTAKQVVRRSDAAAAAFAHAYGGRRTRASGSGLEKGDARVPGLFRIETKRPPTGKYRVVMKEWHKVHDAAIHGGEVALLHLVFSTEYIVMRMADYLAYAPGSSMCIPRSIGTRIGITLSDDIIMTAINAAGYGSGDDNAHAHFGLLTDKTGSSWQFAVLTRATFDRLMEKHRAR